MSSALHSTRFVQYGGTKENPQFYMAQLEALLSESADIEQTEGGSSTRSGSTGTTTKWSPALVLNGLSYNPGA